jgi:penicillin amidase
MLLCAVASLLLGQTPNLVTRGDYGVPYINATSVDDAWKAMGYAVAQDRMWQMELSRRLARGRMAELLGPQYVASDKEVLQTSYTEDELKQQIEHLPASLQNAFTQYAAGVNQFLAEGNLPPEFAKTGDKPEPWTPTDSAAITVRMLQYFGRGGAGQLRNMAVLSYLQSRKPLQGHLTAVLDDFLWQNDPSSPTTVLPEDEPSHHPIFPTLTPEITEKHIAMRPNLGLLDLLPGLSVAQRTQSTLLAMKVGAPFKTGSYCMVVNGSRSATGMPSLLSGPQMGFSDPSVVHEISIHGPGLDTVGMDIPGLPGVVIGHNRHLAWGLTSGVADTDDIVFYPKTADGYRYGTESRPIVSISRTLHVKGGADQTVVQNRTVDGIVVLSTAAHGDQPGYLFARKASYWMRELSSMNSFSGLWSASSAAEADAAAAQGTMSFNVFYATDAGDIGYRYAGIVPIRVQGQDPRFPAQGSPANEWRGFVPVVDMPHVINPKGGLITNWNNKPISWWPNLDTPVWGRIFRVDSIRRALNKPKLNSQDLEVAAWTIARTDETWPFFQPYYEHALTATSPALQEVAAGFDGRLIDGSRQSVFYKAFLSELRKALFLPTIGNFMAPQYFETAAQPSVMLVALEGRTKFNYLQGRKPEAVVLAAMKAAFDSLPSGRYRASGIPVPGETPIPYSNRGTYIQVVELPREGPSGRNVLPPGVAEWGNHSLDQVPLARAWVYKPMHQPWIP